ncbi:MAG: ABC transporter ATP-binding protein [Bacillota bacterium]|jgi:ATP-binding cassette subfamily B protein|nr:ABC transporter ATP-binding protein [Candidatus Fermentithermobacillaceae bacterium]
MSLEGLKGESYFGRIIRAYRELLGILSAEAPVMVVSVFAVALALGIMKLLGLFLNKRLLDDGIALARGLITYREYLPYLVLFVVLSVLPGLLEGVYVYGFVEPRSLLILRTKFKGRMLDKLSRMKYEHLESESSMEIIDKAYRRAENSARHLFPMYVMGLEGLVYGLGILVYVVSIKWWLILTILIPVIAETWYQAKYSKNIYEEIESYWARERAYHTLGGYLRSRSHLNEAKLFGASDYLIDTYRSRLNARNRQWETFYFRHLKTHFTGENITKFAKLANTLLILRLYLSGQITVGAFVALSASMLTTVFENFDWFIATVRYSHYHINFFDYCGKYLALSEEPDDGSDEEPQSCDIEFRDVWFRYPGTDRYILKGISFHVKEGEKLSLVGENGQGKTTIVKLLLRLFEPDRGEILLGGRPLASYSRKVRTRIFGPVFQDFVKYSISLKENIGVGYLEHIDDPETLETAARKGKVDEFADSLPQGYDTILGRDFEGGVDLSGGQWQRVAIARAFMGDKPILLLDEPTSQLDPIAESELYREFAEMAEGKTAIFITHRLASTMITDRILVIQDGMVTQEGTHEQLMAQGGLYADMFNAQKQWYVKGALAGEGGDRDESSVLG